MVHELKTWTEYYDDIVYGRKSFELRKNDRNYQVGDKLHLKRFDNNLGIYTGENITAIVDYCLYGGQFGLSEDYVIMSITLL